MVEARKRKYNDFILKAEEINKKAHEIGREDFSKLYYLRQEPKLMLKLLKMKLIWKSLSLKKKPSLKKNYQLKWQSMKKG